MLKLAQSFHRSGVHGLLRSSVCRWGICVLAVLCLARTGSTQKLPFATLNIRDGMADSVVFCMLQDSDGFLWIGTRTGLNRFDGADFATFTEREGLPHNVVRTIFETSTGDLWVGTENGVSRYTEHGFVNLGVEDGLPNGSIRSIAEDTEGTLWFATYGGGLARYRNETVAVFSTNEGLPHPKVRSLLVDDNGALWIGTFGGGLARLQQGRIETFSEGLGDREIRALWQDSQSRIWVGTRRGVYRLEGSSFVHVAAETALARQPINVITSDHDGRTWIGTREGGAFALSDGLVTRYQMDSGLADNSITAILEDFEGNLWFGTYGGGISRLGGEMVLNWETTDGFSYANVYAIAEDEEGCLWFGTNGGGASRLCDSRFTAFTTDDGLSHDKVLAISSDSSGAMWFGTLDGASRFDGRRWQQIHSRDGLAHNVVYDVIEDRNGAIWFATFGGITRLSEGRFTTFREEDGLAGDRANQLLEGTDGSLWIGTSSGLTRFHKGEFQSWTEHDGLASEFINHMFEDDQGVLWVSTARGLSTLHDGNVKSWTMDDGLSNENCTVALPGRDGTVWIGTNRGVNIFDGESFAVVTIREGLVYDLVNRGAGYQDHEGNLWFGTGAGVSRFSATFRPEAMAPPPVHLTEARVLDEAVPLDVPPRLQHNQNWLTFDFVGLAFRRARDVTYQYRLLGSGRDWRETRQQEVQFSSLPPGRYTFEVTARIGKGPWNPTPAQFRFTIVPPIWRQVWFIALAAAILLAAVGFRVWGLRRQARVLEETVRERTLEVREANQELRWLAHHDRLTNLFNRHYISEIMPGEISRLKRRQLQARRQDDSSSPCLGVVLLDLDRFKNVNDTWNHTVGDRVLIEVSNALRQATRDGDVVARWGGEEFLILLRDLDLSGLRETSTRVLRAIRELDAEIDGAGRISLTCSLGFSHVPETDNLDDLSWETVIQLADIALMEAKRAGRDRGVGFLWIRPWTDDENVSRIASEVNAAVQRGLLERQTIE